MGNAEELIRAYEYCRQVTRRHAKSFYFAAKFLPKKKQLPIYALYALCRHVDDEVDETAGEINSEAEAVRAVENWKSELEKVYFIAETRRRGEEAGEKGRRGGWEKAQLRITNYELRKAEARSPKTGDQNLILLAWSDLLETYYIPQNLPLELMRGVLMDTHVKRYETFDELYVYCYRVASTVGLMSSEIFGYADEKTLDYAEALGIAMQLTNILRDIREDAAMNRIYLPQEDLQKFDVSEEQIFENRMDENFIALMKFEIARAREFYRKAERGIPMLESETRFTVLLAARLYGKILDEIERQNYDVFTRRAHTTAGQKILSIPRIWQTARNL